MTESCALCCLFRECGPCAGEHLSNFNPGNFIAGFHAHVSLCLGGPSKRPGHLHPQNAWDSSGHLPRTPALHASTGISRVCTACCFPKHFGRSRTQSGVCVHMATSLSHHAILPSSHCRPVEARPLLFLPQMNRLLRSWRPALQS